MPNIILFGAGHQGKRLALTLFKAARYLKTQGFEFQQLVVIEPSSQARLELKKILEAANGSLPKIKRTFIADLNEYLAEHRYLVDDIAIIAVPNHLHAEVFRNCVTHGCRRVILEKPVGHSLESIQEIHRLAHRYRVRVMVNEQYLWSTAYLRAQEVARDPEQALLNQFGLIASDYSTTRSARKVGISHVFGVLSKDRRQDVRNGRYTDGLAGHEIPHFLAMFNQMWGQAKHFDMRALDMELAGVGVIPDHAKGFVFSEYQYSRGYLPTFIYVSHEGALERWFEFKLTNNLVVRFIFDNGEQGLASNPSKTFHSSRCLLFDQNGQELASHEYHDDHLRKAVQSMVLALWEGHDLQSSLELYKPTTQLLTSLVDISHWGYGKQAMIDQLFEYEDDKQKMMEVCLQLKTHWRDRHRDWKLGNSIAHATIKI